MNATVRGMFGSAPLVPMVSNLLCLPAMILALGFVSACDGDDAGEALTAEDARMLCEDGCDRALECDRTPSRSECETNCRNAAEVVRADVVEFFAQCGEEVACSEPEDTCSDRADAEFEPLESHMQYAERCRMRIRDCAGEGADVSGCDEEELKLLADAAIARLEACFDESCVDVPGCLVGELGSFALD
jgi:hypothetical protein